MSDGHPDGYGEISNADGFLYRGTFKTGKMHGQGVAYYPDGSQYDGHRLNDKRSGRGIYYYANGSRYEGKWLLNQRHGFGVFYKVNGSTESGQWNNDILVSPLKQKRLSKASFFIGQNQVLQERFSAWKAAWKKGDSKVYLAFYSAQFKPNNDLPLKVWKEQRLQRVTPNKKIEISVRNQNTSFTDNNNTALITFLQTYRSNSFNSTNKKEMLWRKEPHPDNPQEGQWMIVLEASD